MKRPTIALDFDGTLHAYTSGWLGVTNCQDPPTPGAREAVDELRRRGFRVVIYSSRAASTAGADAIRDWLARYGFVGIDEVTATKPPAVLYVDDRGLRFEGDWHHVLLEVSRLFPR